jgi:HAMP domain-containing protein
MREAGASPARYEPGLASDRLTVLFTAPIQVAVAAADDESAGPAWMLVGEASIVALKELVAGPADADGDMRAYLLTDEGDPLVGVNGSAPVPLVGELVRAIASHGDGSGRFAGAQPGQVSIGAYRWLSNELGLALIVEQDYQDVVAPLSGAAALAALSLIPALAVIALIGIWLIRKQLAPLHTISETALRLSSGQFNATIPTRGDDEIGAVATAFNRMAGDLRRQFGQLEAQTAARARMLTAAEAVMATSAPPQRLDVLLARVASSLQEQFEVDVVLIFLKDERDGKLHLRAGTEGVASRLRSRALAYAIEPDTIVGWTASEKAARLVPDVLEDNLFAPLPELPDIRSALALPMSMADEIVGVVYLLARQPAAFATVDLAVYQMVATHLAVSIANSRQYERTQRTRMVEDVVVALAEQVSQTTDPERILTIGARVLGLALDARRATIRLGSEEPAEAPVMPSNGSDGATPPNGGAA